MNVEISTATKPDNGAAGSGDVPPTLHLTDADDADDDGDVNHAPATARFVQVWKAANPTGGIYLAAKAVAAVLQGTGMSKAKLKTIWTAAKIKGNPIESMDQEEFFRACTLVVQAGGTFQIAETATAIVDAKAEESAPQMTMAAEQSTEC